MGRGMENISSDPFLVFRIYLATAARRNRIAVRAGFWMAEERADALVEFRRDDVFEATGLYLSFSVFDGKRVSEQAFSEAMAANYIARAARAGFGQMYFT